MGCVPSVLGCVLSPQMMGPGSNGFNMSKCEGLKGKALMLGPVLGFIDVIRTFLCVVRLLEIKHRLSSIAAETFCAFHFFLRTFHFFLT